MDRDAMLLASAFLANRLRFKSCSAQLYVLTFFQGVSAGLCLECWLEKYFVLQLMFSHRKLLL